MTGVLEINTYIRSGSRLEVGEKAMITVTVIVVLVVIVIVHSHSEFQIHEKETKKKENPGEEGIG